MPTSSKARKFSLENETDLANLREDFWACFEARLHSALLSGALSEEDVAERPMTVARCVLVLTAENTAPRSSYGKQMLANLRHSV